MIHKCFVIFGCATMSVKNVIKILIVIITVVIGISFASKVLENKTGKNEYGFLVENGKDIDVLFVGSSHMWDAIFPMELWNEYGISSYNAGYSSNRMPINYWIIRNSLQFCKPKLVVIDIYSYTEDFIAGTSYTLHTAFDGYPLSVEKIRAVMDLDETAQGKTDKIDMLFDFCTYHSRWNELESSDFSHYYNNSRGANWPIGVCEDDLPLTNIDVSGMKYCDTIGMRYLEKTVEYLQNMGIDVMLVFIPQPCTEEAQEYYNYMNVFCDEKNITFIDLSKENIINPKTDYMNFMPSDDRIRSAVVNNEYKETSIYDNNAHLNVSGAYKITKFIGEYIVENYDLCDHRNECEYTYWDDDYSEWIDSEIYWLKATDNVKNYLMLISSPHFKVEVKASSTAFFFDEELHDLFENIGLTENEIFIDESLGDTIIICVCLNDCDEIIDEVTIGYQYYRQCEIVTDKNLRR